MARYVAFLGSINVGGNRLLMADLREALEREDFENVETVVSSGNVLFDHEERPPQGIADKIAWVVQDRFEIDSLSVVKSRDELVAAIEQNPFHGTGAGHGEDKFVHTIFLDGQPRQENFDTLLEEHKSRGGERLALGERMLFLDYVHGVGVSSLTGPFLERRLGCKGTARNMRSLKRIISKMDETTD
ncbi:DUF1697 domain-containing protein [Altererythrobacter aquiaggeris]|uniref:DUF1697 domain-containing protein n=1 Tax=Aestuarierythrobacter aquiaggeris TaxID=1898396 RepID=UPI0030166846